MRKTFFIAMLLSGLFAPSAFSQRSSHQLQPVTPTGSGIFDFPTPPPAGQDEATLRATIKAPDMSWLKNKYYDVKYGSVSPTQTLDIYLPNEGTKPYPVVVEIHGGAFMLKYLTSKAPYDVEVANAGTRRGYAVVCVNYRLSGEARFPRAVNDMKAIVRFVRANAKKYNFDPNRIIAWGGSAGGNLAAMLGTTGHVDDLNGDNTENLQYPSNVQAVVDWFGPCDFLRYDDQFAASGKVTPAGSVFSPTSGETLYIGQDLKRDTAFTERANPETYIPTMQTADAPYFIIQHGTEDLNIPTVQSVNLASKLRAKLGDDKVYLELLPGAQHSDPAFSTPANFEKVFNLLDKYFKR